MLESTMCWLYDHSVPTPESCELCRLVKTSSQHSVKIYTPLAKSYCATVRLSEVTRRAKTFYIEQTLFQHSRAQRTPVTQKKDVARTLDDVDATIFDDTLEWLRQKSARPLTKFDRFYAKRQKHDHTNPHPSFTREDSASASTHESDSAPASAPTPTPTLDLTPGGGLGSISIGVERLLRFLRVIDIFGTCPWSGIKFKQNEQILRRLIASHLRYWFGCWCPVAFLVPAAPEDCDGAVNSARTYWIRGWGRVELEVVVEVDGSTTH